MLVLRISFPYLAKNERVPVIAGSFTQAYHGIGGMQPEAIGNGFIEMYGRKREAQPGTIIAFMHLQRSFRDRAPPGLRHSIKLMQAKLYIAWCGYYRSI